MCVWVWQELMVEVEVRAAHNVLEACAQTDTIEKVIFTSSVTAVIWRDGLKTMSSDVDERHWSDVNLCRKFKVKCPLFFHHFTVLPPRLNCGDWWVWVMKLSAVARSFQNPSRENSVGLSHGSWGEYGVHKWRAGDGPRSDNQ